MWCIKAARGRNRFLVHRLQCSANIRQTLGHSTFNEIILTQETTNVDPMQDWCQASVEALGVDLCRFLGTCVSNF